MTDEWKEGQTKSELEKVSAVEVVDKAIHIAYLNAVEWTYDAHTYTAFNLPSAVLGKVRTALEALKMGCYAETMRCDKGRMSVCVPDSQFKRRSITLTRVVTLDGSKIEHSDTPLKDIATGDIT